MRQFNILVSCCVFLLFSTPLFAATVVDLSNKDGTGYFLDTDTNLTWMDIDNFFGMSYQEINSSLVGSGFHMATSEEVLTLKNSLPVYTDTFFDNLAGIVGVSPNGYLMRGYISNDAQPIQKTMWYSSKHTNNWRFLSSSPDGYSDSGAWVVQNVSTVPIPSSIWLLASFAPFILFKKNNFLSIIT